MLTVAGLYPTQSSLVSTGQVLGGLTGGGGWLTPVAWFVDGFGLLLVALGGGGSEGPPDTTPVPGVAASVGSAVTGPRRVLAVACLAQPARASASATAALPRMVRRPGVGSMYAFLSRGGSPLRGSVQA